MNHNQFEASIDQHPAVSKVICFLNSLLKKDRKTFESLFSLKMEFLDVLPGGMKVNAQQLLNRHRDFFVDPGTRFLPLGEEIDETESQGFSFQHLIDPKGNTDFFHCGADAFVIKQRTLGEGTELVTAKMHLGLLFLKDKESNSWFPRSIQNTIID